MKRILFLANHYFTLYAFRRELIERLAKDGHEVVLSIPADPKNERFREMGCTVLETDMARRSLNPFLDIKLLWDYMRLYRKTKPDVVFSYTVKPNIYGSIAARFTKTRQICNITGTGETFTHGPMVRRVVQTLYRLSIRSAETVFFQNDSDRRYFLEHRLVRPESAKMLPGSGINLSRFPYSQMPDDGQTRFIYVGRVMGLKGMDQFVGCARRVREKHPEAKFYVAGFAEEGRYRDLIEKSHSEGILEYLGFREDIADWIRRCHCVILPSHGGEGIPNVLLESAATGRASIASRIPGCVDVVEDGITGYLFTPGSTDELVNRVEQFLALSYDERNEMGKKGRARIEAKFNREIVIDAYYKELHER